MEYRRYGAYPATRLDVLVRSGMARRKGISGIQEEQEEVGKTPIPLMSRQCRSLPA